MTSQNIAWDPLCRVTGAVSGWSAHLVHGWGRDGIPQQLAAERAIDAFIHVVQELGTFIVLTCITTLGRCVKITGISSFSY